MLKRTHDDISDIHIKIIYLPQQTNKQIIIFQNQLEQLQQMINSPQKTYLELDEDGPVVDRVDLAYFERRMGNFTLKEFQNHSLQIGAGANSVLLALALKILENSLVSNSTNNLIAEINDKKLKFYPIENFPSEFFMYNHEDTLRAVLIHTIRRLESLKKDKEFISREQIRELIVLIINFHQIVEISLCVFLRIVGMKYLLENEPKYHSQLLGNQLSLLRTYTSDLRNMPLQIIANAFKYKIILGCEQQRETYGTYQEGSHQIRMKRMNNKWFLEDEIEVMDVEHKSLRASVLRRYDEFRISRSNSNNSTNKITRKKQPENSQDNLSSDMSGSPDSRFKRSQEKSNEKICSRCGKLKKNKFCECRKLSTPKNNKPNFKYVPVKNANQPENMRKCKKCRLTKSMFMNDQYCGECIGNFTLKRCSNCNELFQGKCEKCKK